MEVFKLLTVLVRLFTVLVSDEIFWLREFELFL
jgi:hypothetical protein